MMHVRQLFHKRATISRSFSLNASSPISSLKDTNFISIAQLSKEQLNGLITKAQELKDIYKHSELRSGAPKPLENFICSMIFQKRSTRTRMSSEVGMHFLGGKALFLSSDDIQLGVNETLQDTALVLSRLSDILLARVNRHEDIEKLSKFATVPVINALSDKYHPLQALADFMTIKENFGNFEDLTIAWIGDGNNVLHDYMIAAAKLGTNVQIATPERYEPDKDIVDLTEQLTKASGTRFLMTHEPSKAVQGANVIATDTWISMGQEEEAKKRLHDFAGYQVSKEMLRTAASKHIFLHCLPRHKEEVTDEVFYSKRSVVFDEAENRLWTVMAVYLALLGKDTIN